MSAAVSVAAVLVAAGPVVGSVVVMDPPGGRVQERGGPGGGTSADVASGAVGPDLGHSHPAQRAVRPPSTTSVWPVMNEAWSDARKATAAAISSGRPHRRIGTRSVR